MVLNTGGMFQVEIYGRVRRAVVLRAGVQRAVAREFGLSRKAVRKMLVCWPFQRDTLDGIAQIHIPSGLASSLKR